MKPTISYENAPGRRISTFEAVKEDDSEIKEAICLYESEVWNAAQVAYHKYIVPFIGKDRVYSKTWK